MASSSSTPADGASGGASVTEGKATIYFPSEKGVFYNPPQIPNRDLSVLALREFSQRWQREMAEKAAKAEAKQAARAAYQAAQAAAAEASAAPAPAETADAEAVCGADASDTSAPAGPPRVRVLDAMTASGLRALRYVLEVKEVESVVANDIEPAALAALRDNVRRNGLNESVVIPSHGDAVAVMAKSKPPEAHRFEAVEIDP